MASLYQRKNGVYYLSVVFQGSRSTKSLETRSKETAKAILPYVERQLLDQLTWSRNRRRLGLRDARMHDLRRTFGYNLIKQGRPIYEVSKLIGHSSVTTTERHYSPLIATEIKEFIL